MYAAQLFEAARASLGDLDAQFARGEFAPLKAWLNENVHRHGKRYRANHLIEIITGSPLSHEPFLRHLHGKFDELYGL
jgi:carboxypeptidase Taq